MKQHKLNCYSLSKHLGVSPSTISRWIDEGVIVAPNVSQGRRLAYDKRHWNTAVKQGEKHKENNGYINKETLAERALALVESGATIEELKQFFASKRKQ